jgi:hypothetical protein
MEIVYTAHAVKRMYEREISTEQVAMMLESPQGIIRQSKDKAIYYKSFKSRKDNLMAAVAVELVAGKYEVLTAMVNFKVQI